MGRRKKKGGIRGWKGAYGEKKEERGEGERERKGEEKKEKGGIRGMERKGGEGKENKEERGEGGIKGGGEGSTIARLLVADQRTIRNRIECGEK